jgi:hypothetical protein
MEKIKELKIGDRVKCIKVWLDKSTTLNQIGTVIKYRNHLIYGQLCTIEFDNYILGHNANGVGKYGFCWTVPTSHLKKVNEIHRSKFINENEVINSEGCIFKVDDYITPTNPNSSNLGKKFKITGFRNNLANTEICAITSTHQPNGIGIDKIELVVDTPQSIVKVEPELSLLEQAKLKYPIGTKFKPLNARNKINVIQTGIFKKREYAGIWEVFHENSDINNINHLVYNNEVYHYLYNPEKNQWAEIVDDFVLPESW